MRRLDNFGVMRLFRLIREDRLLPYLVAGALFFAAVVIRLELDSLPPAIAFITFFPAIALIAVTAGWRIAAAATALSAFSAWWLLSRLADAPHPARLTDLLAVGLFIVGGGVIVGIVEGLAGLAWPGVVVARADHVGPRGAGPPSSTQVGALMTAVAAALDHPVADSANANAFSAARAAIGPLRTVADYLYDDDVKDGTWSERLQGMCDRILRARQFQGTTPRVDAVADGIPPDRRAMLSIIIATLLPTTADEARTEALEIVVRDLGERRHALEVSGTNKTRAPLFDPADTATPRGRVLHAMAESLGATLTFSRDPAVLIRVVFTV